MLASTRFNVQTLFERDRYMEGKPFIYYGAPKKIKKTIELNALLFVVEMNNDTNQIVAIGLIRNIISHEPHFIYENQNYHRYVYVGKYRITREEMEETDQDLVEIFELILFKGYAHIKRHSGITLVPPKLLVDDRVRGVNLLERVKKMFKTKYVK